MVLSLAQLQTEQRNTQTNAIDSVSTLELCGIINKQDHAIADAVQTCLAEIADAIDLVVSRISSGGRVVYIGAGTSGRLGVLDASEIPPTFSAPKWQFLGLIAGGDAALRSAVEGAEDSEDAAVLDLSTISPPLSARDALIGIASSGRTPYVLGGLRYGQSLSCGTIGLACVQPSQMRGLCDVLIECVTGPEVVTGSTRLKAGTATKMILNMISTGSQVRTGKTFGNLMVDLQISNEKLRDRARRVVRAAVLEYTTRNIDDDKVLDDVLDSCAGSVKLTILVLVSGCSPEEGKTRLELHSSNLRAALQAEADQ